MAPNALWWVIRTCAHRSIDECRWRAIVRSDCSGDFGDKVFGDSFTESDLRSKIKLLSVWTGCSELERASGCIPTLNAPLNGYWSSGIHFSSGEIMADLIALFDLECSCRSSHQLNSFWTSGLKRRGSQRACWTTLNAERSPASLIYRATCGRRALLGALLMVRTVQV